MNIHISDEFNARLESIPVDGKICVQRNAYNAIPTLSEWGMIILMTIIVGIGVITVRNKRMV